MEFPKNYIRAGAEYCTLEKYVPAPYLRRTFSVNKEIFSARLLIGCAGYYEVHINGTDITKGAMAPYRSNPDHLVYFDCYDVTNQLRNGQNVLGFILGNGFQNGFGGFIWDFEKAPWRGAPQVTFSLTVTYADGTGETIESDSQTRTAPSPILFDDVHYGEYYDARLEIPGWDAPEFDDSRWNAAEPAPLPRGEARLCEAEPIRFQEEITPVDIFPCEKGYVYDFGRNGAGLCRLTINGIPGQKLLLKFFEQLADGKPYYKNIRFVNDGWNYQMRYQEDEYTCSGKGTEVHVPRFTYHGFRYVYIEGITAQQATPKLLTYLVLHSDLKTIGSFRCSDPVVNAIQEATVRSDRTNFHYFPTDCPQREKNGWTGDASLSAEQILTNLDASASFAEWLRNIYKAYNDAGSPPDIVPTGTWGYTFNPAWDSATTSIAYHVYAYRGNRAVLEEFAVPLMRQLTLLYSLMNEDDLVDTGLGDWCQPDHGADGYTTPRVITATLYSLDIAQKAVFIYDVLGMPEQKAYAEALAARLTKAFRTHLIDHKALTVQGDTQTGQALALQFGMFTGEEFQGAFDHLLQLIHDANDHMDVGVLGARYIFRVLADHGEAELAYKMITRDDHPAYGNWIARGATTLWEDFQAEDHIFSDSMNHHFWGDVSSWFCTYLAGLRINPSGRDATHVDIAPEFISALTFAEASYQLPGGEIAVHWERRENGITLTVTGADALHGTIRLPDGYAFEGGTTQQPLSSGTFHIHTEH